MIPGGHVGKAFLAKTQSTAKLAKEERKHLWIGSEGGGVLRVSVCALCQSAYPSLVALPRNHGNMRGNRSSVSSVEETRPPMTTVASGRWTSAPVVVAIAMGRNPRPATTDVMMTGRSLRDAASDRREWNNHQYEQRLPYGAER